MTPHDRNIVESIVPKSLPAPQRAALSPQKSDLRRGKVVHSDFGVKAKKKLAGIEVSSNGDLHVNFQ